MNITINFKDGDNQIFNIINMSVNSDSGELALNIETIEGEIRTFNFKKIDNFAVTLIKDEKDILVKSSLTLKFKKQ